MKTVRVRIAVVVDDRGRWGAMGASEEFSATQQVDEAKDIQGYHPPFRIVWVEADVPCAEIPEPATIQGEVRT